MLPLGKGEVIIVVNITRHGKLDYIDTLRPGLTVTIIEVLTFSARCIPPIPWFNELERAKSRKGLSSDSVVRWLTGCIPSSDFLSLAEHELSTWRGDDACVKVHIPRAFAVAPELQVVINDKEREQRFELVRHKKPPGTVQSSGNVRAAKAGGAPCLLSVPEWDVLQRRVHKLVHRAFSRLLSHAREPERVEHFRVWVHRFIVVRCMSRGGEERALGDECSVAERDVLERHA